MGLGRYNCAMGNELIFEGKKYISAKRASQITGYNSDYIGQLCRKGSLECRLVGRSWFVEEKSLENHKTEASKTPRGRIPIYAKESPKEISKDVSTEKGAEKTTAIEIKKTDYSPVDPIYVSPAFRPYDHNLLAVPSPENDFDSKENSSFTKKIIAASVLIFVCILSAPFLMRNSSPEKIETALNVSKKIVYQINANSYKHVASVTSSIKDLSFSLGINPQAIHDLRIKTHKLTLKSYHLVSTLPTVFFDTTKNMRQVVMRGGEKIYDGFVNTDPASDRGEAAPQGVRAGVTVVPSSGDAKKDEKIKQYIKDSFSDETRVVPDESGTSGVIKPIFKKQSDQDYLYVIVPVKD